jgi:hypothetical protein
MLLCYAQWGTMRYAKSWGVDFVCFDFFEVIAM